MQNKFILKLTMLIMLVAICILIPSTTITADAYNVDSVIIAEAGDGESSEENNEETDEDTDDETTPADPESLFKGVIISQADLPDENLYTALLKLYRKKYTGTEKSYLGSTIYSDMFKEIEDIDLSSGTTRVKIDNMQGLELLDLGALKSFSADLNNISKFDPVYFQNTNPKNFTKLSLAGNQLTKIDLTGLTGLYEINLSNNQLTQVDFSKVEGKSGGNTHVTYSLAGNQIASMDNIVLPTRRIGHITLNIIGNNITSIDDKYFSDNYTMQIGMQGFTTEEEIIRIDTKKNIRIYETGIEGLSVVVYKLTDEDFDEVVADISTTSIEGHYKDLALDVGEYEFEYILDGESAYINNDIDKMYLNSHKFNIIPQAVNYVYSFKGKETKTLDKVTGIVTVKLSSPENAKIYYKVNGSDWIEGDVVTCDKGGNYSIQAKAVINGYESEEQNIWVRTSLNIFIPDILMLVLVLLFSVTIFFVVIPIVSKKYFKKD